MISKLRMRDPAPGQHTTLAAWALRLVGLALLVTAGWAAPTLAQTVQYGESARYRVGAPDELTVTILPEPMIERSVIVRPDGMITIDMVGDVLAGGRTVEEIAQDVQMRIGHIKQGALVTVAVSRSASIAVTLTGEVNNARALPLLRETRVAEAIAESGGLNQFANPGGVRVIRDVRGETTVYRVDLNAIHRGDLSTNVPLVDGDIIHVPSTRWATVGHAMNALLYPFKPFLYVFAAFESIAN